MLLASRIYGEHHPRVLIMLHGLFASGRVWHSTASALSSSFSVHALDLRNHGRSGHASAMSYADMATDVIEYMDEHAIETGYFIGHSMGGKVTMQLAADQPSRISALVVEDIAPVTYSSKYENVFAGVRLVEEYAPRCRAEADELLQEVISEARLRAFILTNLSKAKDGVLRWHSNMSAIAANMGIINGPPDRPKLPYPGAALFLRGAQSDYILPDHHDIITSGFPRAEINTIDSAGHWLHADQPDKFLDSCLNFLLRYGKGG